MQDRYYSGEARFPVAVDCIIFGIDGGELKLLLTRRSFMPEMGKWTLMGGFTREDESVDQAAERVLRELTGLENTFMTQVGAFGDIGRDPGARVISVAYYALLDSAEITPGLLEAHNAEWVSINKLPTLGFDHPQMIALALKRLRRRISHEPVAFRLLPERFTLSRLQAIYELILDETIDKRNFRKRVAELPCVIATGEIDKLSSKRGAMMFRFSEEEYQKNPIFRI